MERELQAFPHVAAVSPAVSGQGTLTRGEKVTGVRILGADPRKQDRIVALTKDLIAGSFLDLGTEEVVIGYRLAEELGVGIDDRARITSSRVIDQRFAKESSYRQEAIDSSWCSSPCAAQSLFATGNAVTAINFVGNLFAANTVADQVEASLVPAPRRCFMPRTRARSVVWGNRPRRS